MPELTSLFPDVADALDIESVAIVEKDYFVVDLLRLLKEIKPETHTLVFAGGTALSKAGISLNRMSEDIDIKLVPTENFMQNGRDKRRKIRKEIVQIITDVIHNSDIFSLDNENARITRDEYRYNEISVRYPQTFAQVPCLRPFIKLELMESTLLEHPESRDIYSLVTELTGKGTPVTAFPCATILSTQAEKLISMMRRTAAHLRNPEQQDDEFLVHAVDVEGKARGVETELASLLGEYKGNPVTYAGGVGSMKDIEDLRKYGKDRLDVTVGSALDLFGGNISFSELIKL